MRSYMEGKKYRENKGESAIMEKMKKYIKNQLSRNPKAKTVKV